MLSDTDVHYIAGYLYVVSGESFVRVTLGEKLYDAKADERRDVDITVVVAGSVGVLAAEVKHHRRRLDVTAVEQMCQKLTDMPEVTTRAIVSSSGFTAPALRKASSHGVSCLRLVRGGLPRMKTIDISSLSELTVVTTAWVTPPAVTIGPSMNLRPEEKADLTNATAVLLHTGEAATLRALADRIASQADLSEVDFDACDERAVELIAPFDYPVSITLRDRVLVAMDARIHGVARRATQHVPIHTACYLADERNEPFAAAAVFEHEGRLIGLGVAPNGQTLRIFHIPAEVRNQRPVGCRIFSTTT
jgi:hypothetical protein